MNYFELLFEKVNKFYEDCFLNYGKFLSKYYISIIAISFAINLGLSFGILKLKLIDDVDEIYGVQNSEAKRQERYLKTIFNTTDTLKNKYYLHQLIDFGTWAEVNFRVGTDKNKNILKIEYLKEIESILEDIKENVIVNFENKTYRFQDVCAKRHKKCMIDNQDMLDKKFFDFLKRESNKKVEKIRKLKRLYMKRMNLTSIEKVPDNLTEFVVNDTEHYINEYFDFIPLKFFLGEDFYIIPRSYDIEKEDFAYAKLFKLRLSLSSNHDDDYDPIVKAWELELLKYFPKIKPNVTSFTYGVSNSLNVEMDSNIRLDLKFVAFTFLLIMMFSILLMSLCSNIVSSPGISLPVSGILSAVFGLTSAIGT
jgi:hypothetical protein